MCEREREREREREMKREKEKEKERETEERREKREMIAKGSESGVYQLSRVETSDGCCEQLCNNFCVVHAIDEPEDFASSKTTTRKARVMLIPAFLLTCPSCV